MRYGINNGLKIVSIGANWHGETPAAEFNYAEEMGFLWTLVFDEHREVVMRYGIFEIPQVTLIDPEGNLLIHGHSRATMISVREALNLKRPTYKA